MKIRKTSRGFDYVQFTDKYEQRCSLQKSSLATEDCIWLGVENTGPNISEGGKFNVNIPTRMHLNQKQVVELLPYLHNFVNTGEIK